MHFPGSQVHFPVVAQSHSAIVKLSCGFEMRLALVLSCSSFLF